MEKASHRHKKSSNMTLLINKYKAYELLIFVRKN